MKQTYIVFLLLLSLSASAQKIRYTDKRNHWATKGFVYGAVVPICEYTRVESFGNDTIIRGKMYQPFIITESYNPSLFCGSYSTGSHSYMREDTTTGIIYNILTFGPGYDTIEHVLYNFNLNVGDTITYKYGSGDVIDSVVRIDSTMINGINHKVFTMIHTATYSTGSVPQDLYTIVEGVGSLHSYSFPFSFCFESGEQLQCFYQEFQGINYIPINSPYNVCSWLGDSLNTAITCPALNITAISKLPATSITPNPATDEINITFDGDIKGGTFTSVYDMNGKIIFNNSEAGLQKTININTASWREGLYMILVQNNYGVLKKERVLIVR